MKSIYVHNLNLTSERSVQLHQVHVHQADVDDGGKRIIHISKNTTNSRIQMKP